MKRSVITSSLAAIVCTSLSLFGVSACKKDKTSSGSSSPYEEDEKLDSLEGSDNFSEDELEAGGDEEEYGEEEDERWSKALAELPKRPALRKKCRGKGKRRKCKMVDPKPGIAASYGVREFMGPFRFGMEPKAVIYRLSKAVHQEYEERMAKAKDPEVQDEVRQWRRAELDKIRKHHVKFDGKGRSNWGASIIEHEFEEDANEEMVWQRVDNRKDFFFFKDEELWKIVRAYDTSNFEGKDFQKIIEDDWKKQFGVSPEVKKAKDQRTGNVVMTYIEWQSSENGTVRAFDLSTVQGAYVLTALDRGMEGRIGVRLPNVDRSSGVKEEVKEVIGGSDVCYDDDGNMIESRERCKEIRGF